MKIMDDYYLKKSQALREAQAKWDAIRLIINVVWVLVAIIPLWWAISADASATHYVILGLSWMICRSITVRLFAVEFVTKSIEKINKDFLKSEKKDGTLQNKV